MGPGADKNRSSTGYVSNSGHAVRYVVIKLKVACIFGRYFNDECVRVIAMDESSSLYDLHDMIQESVLFGRDHPFTFYTANSGSPWAERHWIADEEDWGKMELAFYRTKLRDIWPLGRKKLYYWFDFGDKWIFEIRKIRSAKEDTKLPIPTVLERIGPNPQQYPAFREWDDL